jgi:hypothetical protein
MLSVSSPSLSHSPDSSHACLALTALKYDPEPPEEVALMKVCLL